MKKYGVMIWGYVFFIEADNSEDAKSIAITQYNNNPPDGIKVNYIKDNDYILLRELV